MGSEAAKIHFHGGKHKMPKRYFFPFPADQSRTQTNQPAHVYLLFKMSPPAAVPMDAHETPEHKAKKWLHPL